MGREPRVFGPRRAVRLPQLPRPLSFSYCSQMLSKEVDACVTDLLRELVRFQDRMYQKDPVKAKTKRRLVLGLREVLKHLKLRKLKCIIISPNCEKIQSKGNELGRVVPARPQPGRLLPTCDRGPFPGGHLPTRGPALCSRQGCGLFALRPKELCVSEEKGAGGLRSFYRDSLVRRPGTVCECRVCSRGLSSADSELEF